jgi:hypothetical protein
MHGHQGALTLEKALEVERQSDPSVFGVAVTPGTLIYPSY